MTGSRRGAVAIAGLALVGAGGCSSATKPPSALFVGGLCAKVPLSIVTAVGPAIISGRDEPMPPDFPTDCRWTAANGAVPVDIAVATANASANYAQGVAGAANSSADRVLTGVGTVTLLSRVAVSPTDNGAIADAYTPTARIELDVSEDKVPPTAAQLRALLAPVVRAYLASKPH